MATVNATELVHLTHIGNFQLDTEARVVRCRVVGDASVIGVVVGGDGDACAEEEGATTITLSVEITLDVTTMHPRGGGQPSDIGTITSGEVIGLDPVIVATIRDVTIDRSTGVVVHAGVVVVPRDASFFFADASSSSPDEVGALPWLFPPGSNVVVRVDPDRRLLNSECHTAGHVVDAAMARCDESLSPVKGYHFADGPYVEYDGKIDAKDRDAFLVGLRAAFQELINEDMPTEILSLPSYEAGALCDRPASNNDDDDGTIVRVVKVAGRHTPCGGTHVRSTGELRGRGWCVRGLKCKGGRVRVRYGPAEG